MSTNANVNKPTNTAKKEADVNRKLQIYGIFSAFQNGKVPSNEQIDVALNSFLSSKALTNPPEKLSSEGKVLVEDAREVVKQAKYLLLSKNEGNLIQDFIWQTTHFDPKAVNAPNAPVSKDIAKQDGEDALQGLRTLGTLLITNGQFRKLLSDTTVLLRDMAGDAASNAANRVRPSDEQLNQMDKPAEDNTWHDAPDFSKDNLKKQAQGLYGGNLKQDARDVAQAGTNAADPHGNRGDQFQEQGFRDTASQGVQNTQFQNTNTSGLQGNDGTQPSDVNARSGLGAVKDVAKDKLDNNTNPEAKQNILQRNEEYRRRTREYFNKKMPQERKDQTIWRLKKMILECQQHPDYSQAIQTLLRLAEKYGSHGKTVGQHSAGTFKEARSGLDAAEYDLRTLIERFANGTSSSDLWDSIGQIYKDAEQDEELKNWFKAMDNYIRRCLLEQGYILEDESSREWDQLYDSGKYLLREKYRSHTDRVVDEIKFLADQFDKDPSNTAFANSLQKLFNDLGNDENGKPVFKPHLLKDLTDVILPAIMENVAYIPIPRIEYSDHQFDAIIENLVLESDNFMPNVFEVASEHYFRWGRKKIANKKYQSMEVKVAGIQMDLRDVSYHVKRKQGFPGITDTGVADILLPGDGFSFKMKVSTADKKDSQNFFKVDKVDVDVKQLNIKLKKSSHKLLFALFKPIMLKVLRPPMQKAIEKAIKDKCKELDTLLFKVKQEADRAKEEAKSDPENVQNIYKRYYDAAQRQLTKGKKKAEDVAADKKVNMAMTKEDSIFPNIHLPGGVSSKASEYKELARKGEKWESPVFSIGSAKKSTDIPAAPKIQTKPHQTSSPNTNTGNGHTGNGFTQPGNGFSQTGNGQTLPGNGTLNNNAALTGNGGLHSNDKVSNNPQGGYLTGQLGDTLHSNGNKVGGTGAFGGQNNLQTQNINTV